jgi:hypothetical protein
MTQNAVMWKNLLSVSEKFDCLDNDERILLFATGEARDSQRQLGGRRTVCMLFFVPATEFYLC